MILAGTPAPLTRSGAQDAARHELAKPIYHRYDDPWPVQVLKAIGRWLDHWFALASRHSPGGGAGAVGLLALVLALVVVARWRLGPIRRDARARPVLTPGTAATAAEHRAAAEAAAARGHWREAVIERMRALARELEDGGTLAPRPGRTADELAAEAMQARPGLGAAVAEAATTFDEVAYGGRPGTAAGYAVVVGADDAVRGRTRTGTGA